MVFFGLPWFGQTMTPAGWPFFRKPPYGVGSPPSQRLAWIPRHQSDCWAPIFAIIWRWRRFSAIIRTAGRALTPCARLTPWLTVAGIVDSQIPDAGMSHRPILSCLIFVSQLEQLVIPITRATFCRGISCASSMIPERGHQFRALPISQSASSLTQKRKRVPLSSWRNPHVKNRRCTRVMASP